MKAYKNIILIFVFMLLLVGCNKNSQLNEENNIPAEIDIISTLHSDETKKVYNVGGTYQVYYYENDKIIGMEGIMPFASEEEAKTRADVLNNSLLDAPDKGVESFEAKGKYVFIKYTKFAYENIDFAELQSVYSEIEVK